MKKVYVLLILLLLLCACGKSNDAQRKIVKYCENGEPVYKEVGSKEIEKCAITNKVDATSIACEDEEFKFNKETKKCENTISIPANKRIGCKDEENYELKNGACYPKNGKGGVKYRTSFYSCPDTGTLNGTKCDFVDQVDPIVTCPEGYDVKDAECVKVTYEEVKEREE